MASNYCNFESAAAKAAAGKDILLCIFDATGEKLLAISGQQGKYPSAAEPPFLLMMK